MCLSWRTAGAEICQCTQDVDKFSDLSAGGRRSRLASRAAQLRMLGDKQVSIVDGWLSGRQSCYFSSPPTMTLLLQLSLIAVTLATSAAASPLSTPPFAPSRGSSLGLAPLVAQDHVYGSVDNSYIVMFKDDVSPQLRDNHLNFLFSASREDPLWGDESGLTHVYDGPVQGYAGKFTERVVDQIRAMPEVDFVERDQIVRTQNTTVQGDAPWVSRNWSGFGVGLTNKI